MLRIVLYQFPFDNSFIPLTILFPPTFNRLYPSTTFIFMAIRLWLNGGWPINWVDWRLFTTLFTQRNKFYLRDDNPRKIFASYVSDSVVCLIKRKIHKPRWMRESHFPTLILSIERELTRLQSKYVQMYENLFFKLIGSLWWTGSKPLHHWYPSYGG